MSPQGFGAGFGAEDIGDDVPILAKDEGEEGSGDTSEKTGLGRWGSKRK